MNIPDIADHIVSEEYYKIWEDVSKPVQIKKAKNHSLSAEQAELCFNELVKRPSYLCNLAKKFGVKNIVEVGTAQGLQSYSFAEYLRQESQIGHIWTCDIINVRNQEYEEKYKNFITFCMGNSELLSGMLESVDQKIDLFYIDGAHGRGDVIRDVYFLKQHQSENPVWIFDDYDVRFGCYDDITSIMGLSKRYQVYRVGNTASGNPNHQVIIHGKL